MERVALSVAQHAGLLTVRHKDSTWRTLKTGVRIKHLWTGPEGSSALIEFAPGAALPAHRHNWVEEGIVLRGRLQMGSLDMGPFDYHISLPGSRHGLIRSRQGALAYLQGTSIGHTPSLLRELLGGWLPFRSKRPPHTVFFDDTGWEPMAPGVQIKKLWSGGTLLSGFCRFEPGGRLPGHAHPIEEECMMLSGEVFLGDILLRAGEYQLAAAGTLTVQKSVKRNSGNWFATLQPPGKVTHDNHPPMALKATMGDTISISASTIAIMSLPEVITTSTASKASGISKIRLATFRGMKRRAQFEARPQSHAPLSFLPW